MEKNNSTKNSRTLADVIKHDGIKAKGFGTIPKFITHDTDLTLESKTIYGYFCSLCGNGATTFPSRDLILHTLKLSKDGYYKHYKALIEHGYIKVEKSNPADVKSHNVYTIISKPKKVIEYAKQNKDKKVISDSIDAYGYGILPRAVMIDDRLDIKAKGIYCYLASYAGASDTAFPEKKNILFHLNISEPTYYRYYQQLVEYNYIISTQRKEEGRFGVCDYILNQFPDERIGKAIQRSRKDKKSPNLKNQDTTEHKVKPTKTKEKKTSPHPKKQDITNQDYKKQDNRNQDTIINSVPKNSFSINSINQYQAEAATPFDTIDTNNLIKVFSKQEVADRISLQALKDKHPENHEEITMLYDILCEFLAVENPVFPSYKISGQDTPFITIKNMFLDIEQRHVEYVLRSLNNNDNRFKIKSSPKFYCMTALFHSTRTISYYFDRKFTPKPQEKSKWEILFEKKIERDRERMNAEAVEEPSFDDYDWQNDDY